MPSEPSKRPKFGAEIRPGKRAVVPASSDDGRARISWRLGDADRDGPYAWTDKVDEMAARVLGFLGEKDKLTWAASGAKAIPIPQICKAAQDRLVVIQRDDEDQLWEFRLGGTQRIWGVRHGHICHVLWWDPKHQVCPSGKRNT